VSATATDTRLLTATDVADRWQLLDKNGKPNPSVVYRMTREGLLEQSVVRLGRFYRYRLDGVEVIEANGGTVSWHAWLSDADPPTQDHALERWRIARRMRRCPKKTVRFRRWDLALVLALGFGIANAVGMLDGTLIEAWSPLVAVLLCPRQ
jgi:hypothetical protein